MTNSRVMSSTCFVVLLAGQTFGQEVITLSDGTKCGMSGTAKSATQKDLDRHKNRFIAPEADQIDESVTLAAMLAPGEDDRRFDQEQGAALIGYVIDVKPGEVETCNCLAKAEIDRDTHVALGLSPDAEKNQVVIVEVTPRLRKKMKERGVDWSTAAVRRDLKGKWVVVTGWLLYDWPHRGSAENTNPGGKKNWRGTCWEIHPITDIKVLARPPANAQVRSASLAELHRVHRAHATRTPEQREGIARRNEARLKTLDESERELEEELDSAEAGDR